MKTRTLIALVFALNLAVLDQVTATTTAPPLTYQWYGKGLPLSGQTNAHRSLHLVGP
ncbi:MAG: hypothetical protein KJ072_05795 [Verrucomicrobia bacterium]|nr:hypothetical protein [Verrucomicrobiota bacterium]